MTQVAIDGPKPARWTRLLPISSPGRAFYLVVVAAALTAVATALRHAAPTPRDWATFAVLAVGAAVAQLFVVRTGRSHGFHTAIVFVVAATLLLPPQLIVLMAIAQHGPEWLKERYPWFIQSFNMANFALGSLAAWAVADALAPTSSAAAAASAAVVFVAVNHLVLAAMLRFARGLCLAASGLFSLESLATDLVLAGLGIALATIWKADPWLVPVVIAPLVLSHRSFRVLGLLRDSEERFRALFDAAPIGMVVRDLDGRLLSTNRALEEMLGRDVDPNALLAPEERGRAQELHREVAAAVRDGFGCERRFTTAEGREVFGQMDVTLVRDAGKRPQLVLSMVQDVTVRKQLEAQLLQAQKMEAIGRLAGGVAHDFNNLLTAISGYAEFAAERIGDSNPKASDDIVEISKAARRAHELTAQLLAFSRKQVLKPQTVELKSVVADVDPMLRRLIGEHIDVVTVHRAGVAHVRADPGQLQQVIVNLVVNARDEMPAGGTLTIETSTRAISSDEAIRRGGDVQPGTFATLTIRDTGRGMDDETKARLFEPFFTRKEVGKGTGLGLAMVYGIVKQSGGFIGVESELGRGASLTVFLPSVDVPAEASEAEDAEPAPVPRGSESILLVEDEQLVRRFVQTVLDDAGYDVVVAADGHEALERAAERRFDLLLTDLVMPKLNGADLAARLDVPVIYMSGYSEQLASHRQVLRAGARLMQKPFRADELKHAVREALDERSEPT